LFWLRTRRLQQEVDGDVGPRVGKTGVKGMGVKVGGRVTCRVSVAATIGVGGLVLVGAVVGLAAGAVVAVGATATTVSATEVSAWSLPPIGSKLQAAKTAGTEINNPQRATAYNERRHCRQDFSSEGLVW